MRGAPVGGRLLWRSLGLALLLAPVSAAAVDGAGIVRDSLARNPGYPFEYVVQSMVLIDRDGHRDVRRLRRYTRVERDGTIRILLRFTDPEAIRGTALLARVAPNGAVHSTIYLPALGGPMVAYRSSDRDGRFLGSDFAVADLLPEQMADYRYRRLKDRVEGDDRWFVVEARPRTPAVAQLTGYSRRLLFVRQDNRVIDRVDYFREGRLIKRLRRHDLRHVALQGWVSDMVVMESFPERHRSILKTDSRIFGRDFVPPSLFDPAAISGHGPR
ncbi:MAG: outer membrane lipoprotein-sorting protein [Zetaproteobacteria bacterium]|nr:MAG: outer membrane lipoprotein-sorting protein [Zetaproteobacteria bacterium]